MKKHDDIKDYYHQLESPFEQSESELWGKISTQIEDRSPTKTRSLAWIQYAAAAVVLLLISTGAFVRFYSKTVSTERGEHLAIALPDDSSVELNAESIIRYKPYWWKFQREVKLEGEAFFLVENGSTFKILSRNGITEVVGTSFNIYARGPDYRVFCQTGRVKVMNVDVTEELLLNPGELGVISTEIKRPQIQSIEAEKIISWLDYEFNFISEPLTQVIEEIERQFNVDIQLDLTLPEELLYTGYFAKTSSVESALNLISKSFSITFEKIRTGVYVLKNE